MEVNADQALQLPIELLIIILRLCDDSTLAKSIPRVCKLFNTISNDNGDIWKQKCVEKYSDKEIKNLKTDSVSWKQLGFIKPLRLFPLQNGWTLGKQNWAETCAIYNTNPYYDEDNNIEVDARANGGAFSLRGNNDRKPILARIYKTPDEWRKIGFDDKNSFNDYMRFFRLHNCPVTVYREPHVKRLAKYGIPNCFKATIEAELPFDGEIKGYLKLMWKRATGDKDTKSIVWDAALSVGVEWQ